MSKITLPLAGSAAYGLEGDGADELLCDKRHDVDGEADHQLVDAKAVQA